MRAGSVRVSSMCERADGRRSNPIPAERLRTTTREGGTVRGAAGGAAVDAIGGNAGKGAAIGAGVGAATGLIRQGRRNQQAAQAQQQAQAQAQAGLNNYDRAYAACMQGCGYQVR
jgi:hypothetical protein